MATRRDWWQLAQPRWSSLHTNSFYQIAASVSNAAFGFLFWTAAARFYQPQEVGLAAAALSAVQLLSVASLLGLDYALVRFLPSAHDAKGVVGSSLMMGMVAALILSLIFISGLGFWAPALLSLRQSPVFMVSLVIATAFTTVASLLASVFLARMNSGLIFVQSSIFGAARVLFVVALAAVPYAAQLIEAWTLALIVTVACGILLLLPRIGGQFGLQATIVKRVMSDMSHFALANYVFTVIWSAPGLVLPLIVINMVGREANAYFYVATHVSGLLVTVPLAVSLSLFADGSHDADHLVLRAIDSAKLIFFLLVPAIGFIFLFGQRILLMFGASYSKQGTEILWVLALGTLPLAINLVFFSVKRVQQSMGVVMGSAVWILLVTLSVSAALLPRMGLIGAGIGWSVAQGSLALLVLALYLFGRV